MAASFRSALESSPLVPGSKPQTPTTPCGLVSGRNWKRPWEAYRYQILTVQSGCLPSAPLSVLKRQVRCPGAMPQRRPDRRPFGRSMTTWRPRLPCNWVTDAHSTSSVCRPGKLSGKIIERLHVGGALAGGLRLFAMRDARLPAIRAATMKNRKRKDFMRRGDGEGLDRGNEEEVIGKRGDNRGHLRAAMKPAADAAARTASRNSSEIFGRCVNWSMQVRRALRCDRADSAEKGTGRRRTVKAPLLSVDTPGTFVRIRSDEKEANAACLFRQSVARLGRMDWKTTCGAESR